MREKLRDIAYVIFNLIINAVIKILEFVEIIILVVLFLAFLAVVFYTSHVRFTR